MKRVFIKDIAQFLCANASSVKVQGFVERVRDQKYVQFLILKDSSGSIQIVAEKNAENEEINKKIALLTQGSTATLIGKPVTAPNVKLGGLELQAQSLEINSLAQNPLPIAEDSSPELQVDFRQVSLRRPDHQLIFKVQSTAEAAMHDFWRREDFTVMHTPKLMGSPSESGAEVFSVDYFGRKAYLAQSPQFYKQMAMAGGIEKFAEIGPIFRADPSSTPRHNSEFVGVDMEMAWVDSHTDVMRLEEKFIASVFQAVADEHKEEIKKYFKTDLVVPTLPFPVYSLEEIKSRLAERGHMLSVDDDLDPVAERMMGQMVRQERGHDFYFATDYPASTRAFYHMRYPDRPNITKSFDLIYKGMEITTGAQREHRLDLLQAQAVERGMDPEKLKHYFDFFAYGVPPHGGCGIGLGRLLAGMLDLNGVTAVTLLPRTMTRLTP